MMLQRMTFEAEREITNKLTIMWISLVKWNCFRLVYQVVLSWIVSIDKDEHDKSFFEIEIVAYSRGHEKGV